MTARTPDPRLVVQPDLLRPTFGTRLRRYFLTGLVLAAPLAITASVTWWFINLVDGLVSRWCRPSSGRRTICRFHCPASA